MNKSDHWTSRLLIENFGRILTLLIVLLNVIVCGTTTAESVGRSVMAPSAVMPDLGSRQPHPPSELVFRNPQPFELNLTLPNLKNHERNEIEATPIHGRQKIGIHREIPYQHLGDLSSRLIWKTDGDGVVTYLRVRSPEAISVRFSGHLKLPAGTMVTFYRTDPSGQVSIIDSFNASNKGFEEKQFWSPHAIGEHIGVEIRLPRAQSKEDVVLELFTIAHRFRLPHSSVINALQCSNHEEIQCAIDDQKISDANAKAALRVTFESGNASYSCSGTLMNVPGDGEDVYIPYVITAAHCISTEQEASSVVAWWNYQTATCTSSAISSEFTLTFGGADLLATVESYDQTLIRLHEDPPAGAAFSGWWVTDVGTGETGSGAHHPDGTSKKFFSGTTIGNFNVTICDPDDNCTLVVDAIQMRMDDGTSEPGSSGSGMRIYNDDEDDSLFVGVISGSDSECNNGLTSFGAFHHFYPSITTWFDPIPPPPPPLSNDDHGDTEATATSIGLVSTTEGELEEAGDIDYFQVEVDRRGTIQVYTSGSLDTVGQLTSADGDVDITDDDSGDSFNFLLAVDVQPGTYYISVEGYSDATGNYTLHVEFEENDDHGDTFATATTVSSSARAWIYSTIGHLEVSGDVDVFELTLSSTATFSISTEGDSDTIGRLTDYNGFDLFENDDTDENDTNFTLSGDVEAGVYFLFVEGKDSDESQYKLIIDIAREQHTLTVSQ